MSGFTTIPLGDEAVATMSPHDLTDGSKVWNVAADLDGIEVLFACRDEVAAYELSRALNAVCWFERSGA